MAVKKEGYVQVLKLNSSVAISKFDQSNPRFQHISLGLFRSDYMVHKDVSDPLAKPEIKQVEFNTIASSFGGLAAKVSALHRFVNLSYSSQLLIAS